MVEEKVEIKKEDKIDYSALPINSTKDKLKNKKTVITSLLIAILIIAILIIGAIILSISQESDMTYSNKETDRERVEQIDDYQVVEANISTGKFINPSDATPSAEITKYFDYEITFPFIRDGNIYLYKNGSEDLIISKPIDKNIQLENDASYIVSMNTTPRISPDSKHVAYLEYDNLIGEGYSSPDGELMIFNINDKI